MSEGENLWENINVQIIELLGVMLATAISIIVLLEIEEQKSGKYPCKDYEYIRQLAIVSSLIILATSAYFTWIAWRAREQNPGNTSLEWLFTAAALGLLSAVIQTWQAYTASSQNGLVADQELEEVVD